MRKTNFIKKLLAFAAGSVLFASCSNLFNANENMGLSEKAASVRIAIGFEEPSARASWAPSPLSGENITNITISTKTPDADDYAEAFSVASAEALAAKSIRLIAGTSVKASVVLEGASYSGTSLYTSGNSVSITLASDSANGKILLDLSNVPAGKNKFVAIYEDTLPETFEASDFSEAQSVYEKTEGVYQLVVAYSSSSAFSVASVEGTAFESVHVEGGFKTSVSPAFAEGIATVYTVSFDPNYEGAELQKIRVASGKTVSSLDISRRGFRFAGWFSDSGCTVPFNFALPVTENKTLYAKWEETSSLPVFPEDGATDVKEDTRLFINFDSVPVLGSGSVKIYEEGNSTAFDTIDVGTVTIPNSITTGSTAPSTLTFKNFYVQVYEKQLVIIPLKTLANNKTYIVEVPASVVSGNVDGKAFEGTSYENPQWRFTTRAAKPSATTNLIVGNTADAHYATVQAAINAAASNSTITLKKGTYHENINSAKTVTLVGDTTATYGSDVIIRGKNCTVWNNGTDIRPVFRQTKNLTLMNLSIVNAYDCSESGSNHQAEALYFNSTSGKLAAYNCTFSSYQDTILSKGKNWFYKCKIEGDVDFIWGYAEACLIEDCDLVMRGDRQNNAYIFETRIGAKSADTVGKGYVLFNSRVTVNASSSYLARRASKKTDTSTYYDQAAIVNTAFSGPSSIRNGFWYVSNSEYEPDDIAADSNGNKNVGWKVYGNTGISNVATTYGGTFSAEMYGKEYNGRRTILNRVYNKANGSHVACPASTEWDVSALETLFGAVEDDSKNNDYETVTATKNTYNFTTASSSTVANLPCDEDSSVKMTASGVAYHGSSYGVSGSNATFTFPVTGAAKIYVYPAYKGTSGTLTLKNGSTTVAEGTYATDADTESKFGGTDAQNPENWKSTLEYTGGAGTLTLTMSGSFYLGKIVVDYTEGGEVDPPVVETLLPYSFNFATLNPTTSDTAITLASESYYDNAVFLYSSNNGIRIRKNTGYINYNGGVSNADWSSAESVEDGGTRYVGIDCSKLGATETVNVTFAFVANRSDGKPDVGQVVLVDNNNRILAIETGLKFSTGGDERVISASVEPTEIVRLYFSRNGAGGGGIDVTSITADTGVPLVKVTLNKTSFSINEAAAETLTATVSNAANTAVTWSSDKPSVATVENGVVTGVSAGTATITATSVEDPAKSASCTVTVAGLATALNVSGGDVVAGGTKQFSVSPNGPVNGTPTYTWSITSGGSFASLSSTTGNSVTVNGTSEGSVTVRVSCSNGKTTISGTKEFEVLPEGTVFNVIRASDVPDGWANPKAALSGGRSISNPTNWGGYSGSLAGTTVTSRTELLNAVKNSGIIYVSGMIDMTEGMLPPPKGTTNSHSDSYSTQKLDDFIKTEAAKLTSTSSYGDVATKVTSYKTWKEWYAANVKSSADQSGVAASAQGQMQNAWKKQIQLSIKSNTTIIGLDENSGIRGGTISITGVSNVVVRNLKIQDAYDPFPKMEKGDGYNAEWDGVVIDSSTYVWIDHCTFEDTITKTDSDFDHVTPSDGATAKNKWQTYDGLLDVKRASDFITMSYNKFANHDKTSIFGHSDSATSDDKHLTVTQHHNYYMNCTQRLPRVRFASMHSYNNYYANPSGGRSSSYCLGVAYNAKIYAEANYFDSTVAKAADNMDSSGKIYIAASNVDNSKNHFSDLTSSDVGWNPSAQYDYTPDAAADLPTLIPDNAGAGKWTVAAE